MKGEHVVRCHECGTEHVCPGPPPPRNDAESAAVRAMLKGQLIHNFTTCPTADGWVEFTVNGGLPFYVNKEGADDVFAFLKDEWQAYPERMKEQRR
jgi:hypothetical protein